MKQFKTPEGRVYITPLECTLCRERDCKSNLIGAVFSLEKDTNTYLCTKKLNFFCPSCYEMLLRKAGLEK